MLDDIDVKASTAALAPLSEAGATATPFLDMLERRRSVTPFRLGEPGPDDQALRRILTVAMRVPDHGALRPWRIIVVQGAARQELADRLAAAFLQSDARRQSAGADLAVRKIKAMLTAAPLVVIVVSCADPAVHIPEWEQILSAGAVCMNLITATAALGYGSIWLTGWTAYDPAALRILGVLPDEKVAGIVPIGAVVEPAQDRARPAFEEFVTRWAAA